MISKRRFRFHLNVGLKVAAMVIFFEVLMLVAYVIVTNFFLDQEVLLRSINIDQQYLVPTVLISALVLAGYLTFMIITRIFSPVAELARGTEEILRGNLDVKISVKTGDELELLADRFTAMAAALKADRVNLEGKVLERTRALEAAQREELEKRNEILKLKDEFLFVAAHELRSPVTAIRWSLESVSDHKMGAEVQSAFEDAVNASKNLATLVEDLLNMARLDSKRIPFKKEFVNCVEVAQEVIKEMKPIADKKKVKLSLDAPDGSSGMAMADSRRIEQVLVNLVSNAIKYNKDGGSVSIKIAVEDASVRLDVMDDGPGITRDEQSHVFEKFWRAKDVKGVDGTGLGLFITKRLVEGMSGKVSFESVPDKRTVFTVRLPAANQ